MGQAEPSPAGKAERIAAAFARDTAERRPVTAKGEIPPFYESITPQWLTANLAGGHPGAAVTAFRLDVADNGTSNRRRIFIDWNAAGRRAGLPPSVFCKATVDLPNRLLLSASATFSEVSFYNRVRGDLQIEAPQAYFAGYGSGLLGLHHRPARHRRRGAVLQRADPVRPRLDRKSAPAAGNDATANSMTAHVSAPTCPT